MIGDIDNLGDLRQLGANSFFDPLTESHVGSAASLASAAKSQINRSPFDIDKLYSPAMAGHAGIYPRGQDRLDFFK